jgi:hypothetical protein
MYESKVYDQFANQNESMITNDCIENYMFLADHNPCHLNIALSSSAEDCSEENSKYETDKEQQPEGEYISDLELDSLVCAKFSRDSYACEVYDQFVNQEEPLMTDDCIRNYILLADPNSWDRNLILLSFCEYYSDKEIVIFDDHELISRGQEDDQSSCRGTIMAEQEAAIDVQFFPMKQHVSYLLFKDPMAAFMNLYFSENLEISDFLSLPLFVGKYGFMNDFL